jgi:hypothetical protein
MVAKSGHFETPRFAREAGSASRADGEMSEVREESSTTFRSCRVRGRCEDGATSGSSATVVRWRRETSASRPLAAGAHTALSNLTVEYRFTSRANHDIGNVPSNRRPRDGGVRVIRRRLTAFMVRYAYTDDGLLHRNCEKKSRKTATAVDARRVESAGRRRAPRLRSVAS